LRDQHRHWTYRCSLPSASYSKEEPQTTIGFKVCSTVVASLAENNVWETDYAGDDTHYLGVYYHTDFSEYPKYPILVRNDRFISPNNKGIIPFDATDHDNHFPFSGGISTIGDAIDLGRQRIQ
jgi:hypothetical protein